MELKAFSHYFAAALISSAQVGTAAVTPAIHTLNATNTGNKHTAACQQLSELPSSGLVEIPTGFEIYAFSNLDCTGYTKASVGIVPIHDLSSPYGQAVSFMLATDGAEELAPRAPAYTWEIMKIFPQANYQGLGTTYTTTSTSACKDVLDAVAKKAVSVAITAAVSSAYLHTAAKCDLNAGAVWRTSTSIAQMGPDFVDLLKSFEVYSSPE